MSREITTKQGLLACVLLAAFMIVPFLAEAQPVPNEATVIKPAPPELCALLDDPAKRGIMDGLLFNLVYSCGREAEFFGVGGIMGQRPGYVPEATDVQVNDAANDVGHPSITQSETSISENLNNGTLCSGYNDSCEFFCPGGGGGFTGFSRSTDKATTWVDQGALSPSSFGDPSIVWRDADANFYFAALASGGNLGLWSSTDDCQSFSFVSTPATSGDDKELIQIDNFVGSANYGNIYLVWTDFGFGGRIRAIRSTDAGATWSTPANLSGAGQVVQGAWPAVAPNGDVFVAWLRYASFPNGDISIDVARSTDGGLTYANVTSPLLNAVSPRDAAASAACGRPALNGMIRYLASPQIVVDNAGTLHIVYTYDPDGFNVGDVSNVYYRQSTDNGATWSTEVQLNDDATTSDQYFPTLEIDGSTVMVSFYDRRLDPGNLLQDTFNVISTDGGASWGANTRISDVSSPIVLDPNLATCYHGDYDQTIITSNASQVVQWSDDRTGDPDVFTDTTAGGGCTTFEISGPSSVDAMTDFDVDIACATPSGLVRLAGGRNTGGSMRNVPGCGLVAFDIGPRPNNFGSETADGSGDATSTQNLSANFAGNTIYYQAIDAASCQLSNVLAVDVN